MELIYYVGFVSDTENLITKQRTPPNESLRRSTDKESVPLYLRAKTRPELLTLFYRLSFLFQRKRVFCSDPRIILRIIDRIFVAVTVPNFDRAYYSQNAKEETLCTLTILSDEKAEYHVLK